MAESIRTPVFTPPQLQVIAREFRGQQLVADQVAPPLPVDTESGKYVIYGKDDLYTVDNTWAAGAIPNAITSRESEDTYNTEMRVLRHAFLDKDMLPPYGERRRARTTTRVALATQIAREARVAAAFTATGNYPSGHVLVKSGGAEWDNVGVINTVQPITDMEDRITKVTQVATVTRRDLTIVIPSDTFDKAIRHNAAIRDYFKYTVGGVLTEQILTDLLGVKNILIGTGRFAGSGVQNTANDISTGIATTNLWGENVWIGVVDTANMEMMSFARQFTFTQMTGGQDLQIRQYRMADEGQRGDWIEGAEQRDLKITANFAGALITNTLT